MPLLIQPDESLTSYVRRNLFLSRYGPKVKAFEELATRHVLRNVEVKKIAAAIGWPGCYGFNRLVHNHTMMAATQVIKSARDISYSGKQYVSDGERFSQRDASFCPECVKEDLKILGFSYWRRYGAPYVSVCHKHNIVLLNRCPFCGASFTLINHDLDVMWRRCRGKHLAEARSVVNENPLALRRAKVYYELCTSPHHISDELAVCILRDKAASLTANQACNTATQMHSLLATLSGLAEILERARLENSAKVGSVAAQVIDALVTVYESYDDFERDLRSLATDARATDSLWSTYQAGGMESAHFVEEDVSGVGYWSCPKPSTLSNNKRSHDDHERRRPKIYPCCNLPHPKGKEYELRPVTVMPLPGIPMMPLK